MQKCPKQPIGEPDGWVRSTSWGREGRERRTVCSTDRVLAPTSDDDRANRDGDEEGSDDFGGDDEDGEDDNEDADIFLMQTFLVENMILPDHVLEIWKIWYFYQS